MQIGFVGLGKMGANMVHRLRRDGDHAVVAYDPNPDARASVEAFGATTTASIDELIAKLEKPRGVWIMVPSGKITDDTVAALQSLLETGDTIIDGGNSNYHDSIARATSSAERGIGFIDAGTSGGVWGLEVGYCLMAGGEKDTVDRWRPIFTTLAPPDGFLHVGPPGSGHFVKMVHNGIEYGMLQAYAEGFAVMQAKRDFGELDLHAIAHLWNQGSVVRSWLLELAERAFARDPQLDQLRGWVDDSGEGRWTLEEAMALAVPTPVLALSLIARYQSRLPDGFGNKVIAALRNEFGGHAVKAEVRTGDVAITLTTDRPLLERRREARTPVPFCVVIFGASGDLTKRKLVPALYALAAEGSLPAGFTVVGAGRSEMTDDEFRAELRAGIEEYGRVPLRDDTWHTFAEGLRYVTYDHDAGHGLEPLRDMLEAVDRERGTGGNRLFYFSTPPGAVMPLTDRLNAAGLTAQPPGTFVRVIIEKPFGRDLTTARELNERLHTAFIEEQIYRIDHYLGKETVQNLLVFRFANGIFEPLWNRQYIDNVQITVAEEIGVEGRGSYYEGAGALRDIVQNHIMQLVAIVGMEAPSNFQAEMVRDEKVKLLRAVRPIHPDDALLHSVRGQYSAGVVGGEHVPGYREEKDVAPDSLRETFVALKVDIDNWRWAGTPFYLRTGKRMPKRATEIVIQFRRVPHSPFAGSVPVASGQAPTDGIEPNLLVLRIQPDEGITLRFGAKIPGQALRIESVNMDFTYGTAFREQSPDAYERLLLDCMLGDPTLFAREDEVEEAWRFCTAILDGWRAHPPDRIHSPNYESGTWGPEESDAFMARDGRAWHQP